MDEKIARKESRRLVYLPIYYITARPMKGFHIALVYFLSARAFFSFFFVLHVENRFRKTLLSSLSFPVRQPIICRLPIICFQDVIEDRNKMDKKLECSQHFFFFAKEKCFCVLFCQREKHYADTHC